MQATQTQARPASPSTLPRTGAPGAAAKKKKNAPKLRPIPRKELIKFCRGIASMLKARITMADALKYYAHDHPDADLKKSMNQARANIEAGMPVHLALARTNRFEEKLIGLIRAGADSGQLHKSFESIADRLKKEAEFKSKMKKATLIPCVIINVLILLFVVAQTKIVPQVEGLLDDVGAEPDKISATMFGVSHFTQTVWPIVVGLQIVLPIVFWKVGPARDMVLYLTMARLRLLRNLIMGMRQMLFLGSLHMMHSNGITLSRAIEIAASSVKGTPLYDELIDAGRRYQASGLPFSEALKKYTSCDAQVSHMVAIGEKASSLENQLELLVTMYEEDTERQMEDFTQVMNIIVLLLASVLISAVFIGAFLPIFLMGPKMMNNSGI